MTVYVEPSVETPSTTVDVWVWCVAVPEPVLSELDSDERARASRMASEELRRAFVNAHVGLRHVLSSYLGEKSAALHFERELCVLCGNPHGRPVLNGSGLQFSLSHTHEIAVLAVSDGQVGIDVEWTARVLDVEGLAQSVMTEIELCRLRSLKSEERRDWFYELWTAKEAVAKLEGVGLGLPLTAWEVDNINAVVHRGGSLAPAGQEFWVTWAGIRTDSHYLIAVAGDGRRRELRWRQLQLALRPGVSAVPTRDHDSSEVRFGSA
jgi:4'-phosphopantetheinyl transferase